MNELSGVFWGFDIAASGLAAEMRRSEIVAANIANMHVTAKPGQDPYRRRTIAFAEALAEAKGAWADASRGEPIASGVRVAGVQEDRITPFVSRYEPGHPDADERGFVRSANVDLFREMVDMSVIERSFAANLAALRGYRNMVRNSISNITR